MRLCDEEYVKILITEVILSRHLVFQTSSTAQIHCSSLIIPDDSPARAHRKCCVRDYGVRNRGFIDTQAACFELHRLVSGTETTQILL